MKLQGKVAIITGAGSGLGRASARLFAQEGAKVVVADLAMKSAQETVKMIQEAGGDAVPVQVDVCKASDCERMVRTAITKYGKLDIMFNNAGVGEVPVKIGDLSEEEWNRIIAINLTGVFLGTKAALSEMSRGGGGVIINTSTTGPAERPRLAPAYCAAKAGVIALTKITALDYGPNNIRANTVSPGPMNTPFIASFFPGEPEKVEEIKSHVKDSTVLGRLGEPEEVAQVALFLASDDASYVTGAVFVADGGYFIK